MRPLRNAIVVATLPPLALATLIVACGTPFQASGSDGGVDSATDGPGIDAVIPVSGGDSATDGPASSDAPPSAEASTGDGAPPADGAASDAPAVDADAVAPADGASNDSGQADAGGCSVGQSCVPAAPAGWTGPIEFFFQASTPPGCPSGTTAALNGGSTLNASPATCASCTCSGSISCSAPEVVFSANPGCASLCASGTATASCQSLTSTCGAVDGGSGIYAQGLASTPSASGCMPSAETWNAAPPTWSDIAEGCMPNTANSCGPTSVCSPTTSGSQTCVYQNGDVACPAGPYANKQLIDTLITDTRACSDCTCGTGNVSCGSGTVDVAGGSPPCTVNNPLTIPSGCVELFSKATSLSIELVTAPVPSNSTCTPGGGQPTGSATASDPVTVCCTQ